jgi:hypothetical protein
MEQMMAAIRAAQGAEGQVEAGKKAARETDIDAQEQMLRKDIMASLEGLQSEEGMGKEGKAVLMANLLAGLLAMLNLKDDPTLSEHKWKGGQSFFQVDPATAAYAKKVEPRILNQMEKIQEILKQKAQRMEASAQKTVPKKEGSGDAQNGSQQRQTNAGQADRSEANQRRGEEKKPTETPKKQLRNSAKNETGRETKSGEMKQGQMEGIRLGRSR